MYLGLEFIFAISVANLLSILLVFYYVNRNWSKLIKLENHLRNINQQIIFRTDISNWYESELDSKKLRQQYEDGKLSADEFLEKLFSSEEADRVRRRIVEKAEAIRKSK